MSSVDGCVLVVWSRANGRFDRWRTGRTGRHADASVAEIVRAWMTNRGLRSLDEAVGQS